MLLLRLFLFTGMIAAALFITGNLGSALLKQIVIGLSLAPIGVALWRLYNAIRMLFDREALERAAHVVEAAQAIDEERMPRTGDGKIDVSALRIEIGAVVFWHTMLFALWVAVDVLLILALRVGL